MAGGLYRRLRTLLGDLRKTVRMVADRRLSRSYYPAEKTKGKLAVLRDLVSWLLRYGEISSFYYAMGLDRKSAPDMGAQLSYRSFRRIRNEKNLHPGGAVDYNYVCLLRDKFVFAQFLSGLGLPTPRVLALCNRDSVTWLEDLRSGPLSALWDEGLTFDCFCKRSAGNMGKGVFPLRADGVKVYTGDTELSVEDLRSRLDGPHIIQERVHQHPGMSALHPQSVNTLRLMTFNRGGDVEAFSAAVRVGTGGRPLDNWSTGGILIGVDLASGRLRRDGFYKPGYGTRVLEHPDTMVRFAGFEIPHFHEAVELACRLHRHLYGIHSIGWDIAIADAGPMFIEGNDDWDGGVPMVLETNFKQRFLEMYA